MLERIVVDTSALISMAMGEPEERWFASTLNGSREKVMSTGSVQEFLIVSALHTGSSAQSRESLSDAWGLIDVFGISIVPVTGELALIGASGVARFRGSPARLNFGDGFSYALAKALDCPILCKGNDFAATDVQVIRPT